MIVVPVKEGENIERALKKFKRKFVVGKHHVAIAKALDRVLAGESTRLIINIAPRYGKTELAVKNFIAMGLAINPKAKFIHLSYSDDLARDNSRGVQEILREDSYRRLFPGTKPTSVNTRKWFTTEGGGLYAVSSAGQVTGFGAGIVDEEKDGWGRLRSGAGWISLEYAERKCAV